MHMEGELSALFNLFLFGSQDDVAPAETGRQALEQEFPDSLSLHDLPESLLALLNQADAEGAQTELHQSPVEQALGLDFRIENVRLDIRHVEHVAGGVVVVVECAMVDVAKHRPRTDALTGSFVQVNADCSCESRGSGCCRTLREEFGLDIARNGAFQCCDNNVGLLKRSQSDHFRSTPTGCTHL